MPQDLTVMARDRLTWHQEQSAPEQAAIGDEYRFSAWPEQLPEARRFGKTESEALEAAIEAAASHLARLSTRERNRLLEPIAQLAIKIPQRHKDQIDQLARSCGLSTTQFVLIQCLRAPMVRQPLSGQNRDDAHSALTDILARIEHLERKIGT